MTTPRILELMLDNKTRSQEDVFYGFCTELLVALYASATRPASRRQAAMFFILSVLFAVCTCIHGILSGLHCKSKGLKIYTPLKLSAKTPTSNLTILA
jgi:hypothetical protein